MYDRSKLLTYDYQIFTIGELHVNAPNDRFTSGFTYFARSQRSKCKTPILGKPGWHKSQPLHAEICNLARTNLLMNADATAKKPNQCDKR